MRGGDRGVALLARFRAVADSVQQGGPGGVTGVVAGQRQLLDPREGDVRTVDFGDGDRTVARDDL